jgi:hypothetical protein
LRVGDVRADPHVVGHVQQTAHEEPVAAPHLVGGGGGRQPGERCLHHERTFGARRHDEAVLDLLGLGEGEHLIPVILDPVRPAQPSPRHGSVAHVESLHVGVVHEGFDLHGGIGPEWQPAGVEFQDDGGRRRTLTVMPEVVGSRDGFEEADVPVEDPELVMGRGGVGVLA